MPRSGTTAVGDVLASAPGTAVLHEPFNYLVGLRDIPHYFVLPGGGEVSESIFDQWIAEIRALRLRYKPGVFPRESGFRRLIKRMLGGRAVNSYRRCVLTPGLETLIWKDPFACLAARYLHEAHGIPIVVTLRNPWAVAASFKRMRWAFNLEEIFSRAASATRIEHSFDDRIWQRRNEPVVNAALLWSVVYSSVQDLLTQEDGLIGLSLDELIQRPTTVYAALFDRLGLSWTKSVERAVVSRYQAEQSEPQIPVGEKAHDRKRDLASINQYWRNLLDDDEQALVTETCGELWGIIGGLRMVDSPATDPLG